MQIITVISVLLAIVDTSCQEESACQCKNEFKPVCGVDGITYTNVCELECDGTQLHYLGECGDAMNAPIMSQLGQCQCPIIYDPACGKDGNTYTNVCFVSCAGVQLDHRGECKVTQLNDVCKCPAVHRPVCGVDGVTYSNACFLMCEGVQLQSQGACSNKNDDDRTCSCPEIHDPACGVDGNTYNNLCALKCAGTQLDHAGECNASVCNDRCYCPTVNQPVCGTNQVTYESACCMNCAGIDLQHAGPCENQ